MFSQQGPILHTDRELHPPRNQNKFAVTEWKWKSSNVSTFTANEQRAMIFLITGHWNQSVCESNIHFPMTLESNRVN